MFKIYNFLLFILSPLISYKFYLRKKRGKEDPNRYMERLGVYKCKKTKRSLIWVHAVSVGESLSVIPMVEEIIKSHNYNILFTSTTRTSAKIIIERFAYTNRVTHQFNPIDKKAYVKKFLKYFKPEKAIFVESELWPNLINETHKSGINLTLLNARVSDKSPLKQFFYKIFARPLLKKFDLIIPQEEQDKNRLENLGVRKIKFYGNIKLSVPPLNYDKQELENIKESLFLAGKKKVFLAASTHADEEVTIAKFHKELQKIHPDLLTIIAPRHPNRSADIERNIKHMQISVSVRSRSENITEKTGIYLADTIGELGLFYKLVDIAFIGGSFADIGGHNPIEAMKLDTIPIVGPNIYNFRSMFKSLAKETAVIIVDNISDLEIDVNKLLIDANFRKLFLQNGKKFLNKHSKITDKIIKELISN
jgi:3-deoxy-D-manno-octulosonic-acid transferase